MSEEHMNPAQEAELQRLIVEQAADDKDYVSQRGHLSLDASLRNDGDSSSLYEVIEERPLDVGPARSKPKQSYKVTAEQLKEWRALRNKDHWTYAQIAEYAGVEVKTVRTHISGRAKHTREGIPKVRLLERLEEFQAAYEAGAALREIAEIHCEDLGYKTRESCYQQLRLSLKENGMAIRTRTLKHGMRSANASLEVRRRYNRERQRRRSRVGLVRCDAMVRSGRPCRRWALRGSRYCVAHTEQTRPQRKWTRDNVLEALRTWAEAHGCPPRAHDWMKAADGHPNFTTVYNLFGGWRLALHEADLREQTPREAQLAKGYKECVRPGCKIFVAPSRHYCRDRQCQDARGASAELLSDAA